MEDNHTLATFYENWKIYQDHLRTAVAPLTPEQLALRAAPHLRTIGQIAVHIIRTRVGWFTRFLGEPAGDAGPLEHWENPELPAPELVRGLDVSSKLVADALARWTPADMDKTFAQDWRGQTYQLSRAWVI